MMALGFLPIDILDFIASSSSSGDIFHVSSSESTKMGFAPQYVTGFELAQNENDWQRTSSSLPTPNNNNAKWMAAVQEETAAIFSVEFRVKSLEQSISLEFKKSSKSLSKASTLGPRGAIQLDAKASLIYFCSVPVGDILARQRCMRWSIFIFQV